MRRTLLTAPRVSAGWTAAVILLAGTCCHTPAQSPLESQFPNPRLTVLTPDGGRVGSTVTVTITGTDLEEPQALLFSHPGLKATPVIPPKPPADPKKPPVPPPPVTQFQVHIDPAVPPGFYDARVVNRWGVSNPRTFVVGDLAEVAEKEPNDDVDKAQRVEINTTVNGAIANPTDVDYFVFRGKKGQRVLVVCLTAAIDSRLEPELRLFDPRHRLIAVNRRYRETDALVDCTLPEDGDYHVRLCQYTYTEGSPEHFYRLSVTTAPWIDAVHPCVVEPGKPTEVTVYGRNLPGGQLDPTARAAGSVLEKVRVTVTPPTDPASRNRLAYTGHVATNETFTDGFEYRIRNGTGVSNPFLIGYARAPVVVEAEPNDTPGTAQTLPVPCEVAGRVDRKGDRDWYAFQAKKGQTFALEVFSDRLGAPTDMYFLVRNPATKQDIAEVDDHTEALNANFKFYAVPVDPGVQMFTAPADGTYQVMVASHYAEAQAGVRHYYRLRIAPARPDFHLAVMPASEGRPDSGQLLAGGTGYYTVFAWRHDGFNGAITVTAEGLPAGVACEPQTLGPGVRQMSLVLRAAAGAPDWTGNIHVVGRATIGGKAVVREARPVSIAYPVQPGAGIPAVTRIDQGLALAVRGTTAKPGAPYHLAATTPKLAVVQGKEAKLTLKLTRLWPDFKNPLQAQFIQQEILPNITVNNNQPVTLTAGKDEATVQVAVNQAAQPGTYSLVFHGSTQVPFNKDPKAPQKPPVNMAFPATPVELTVLPQQVAAVTVSNANPTVKVGGQVEVVVNVTRQYDYAGPFKVQLVLPPGTAGVAAADVTIPPGGTQAKLVIPAASNAAPGNRPNLTVRLTATLPSNVPVVHEVKINVNVVK